MVLQLVYHDLGCIIGKSSDDDDGGIPDIVHNCGTST